MTLKNMSSDNNDFSANPEEIIKETVKRKTIDLLPQGPSFIQDTDRVKKFFDATVDQWFQPDAVKSEGGFIGRKSGLFYEPREQYYLEEPSRQRDNYQLEASATSIDNNENINFVYTYPDLVNQLEFEGSITSDESRLFEQELYSWSPPLNVDMLINFSNYYWLITGPTTNTITEPTNAKLDIIGEENISIDGLEFQSGMRVVFTNDDNAEFNNTPFIVEGVGISIKLIDDSEFEGFGLYDTLPYDTSPYDSAEIDVIPEYITISRASEDRNPWSRNNRWFHKDLVSTLNLEDFSAFQARRPIIEYLPNIQLKDYGRWARKDVDFIIRNNSVLDIAGQSQFSIDGDELSDNSRVLFVDDPDPLKNNRIYKVYGLNASNKVGFDLEADGIDPSGDPVEGEKIRITQTNEKDNEYYFEDGEWKLAQEKSGFNEYPQYLLYDSEGTRLDDSGVYPQSDFEYSNIFRFKENSDASPDRFLNIPISFSTFGDIAFENLLTSENFTYELNFQRETIGGYYYYKRYSKPVENEFEFRNDWHLSDRKSRQRVVDRFIIKREITDQGLEEFQRFYDLSIAPIPNTSSQTNYIILLNGLLLEEGIDFDLTGRELELSMTLSLEDGDVLEAFLWNPAISIEDGSTGYFEVPLNLEANPNNREIDEIQFNGLSEQFVSIIENQAGISGKSRGPNNYRNTKRELNKGRAILHHRAPLLKTMLVTGDKDLSFPVSLRYVQREYSRFKNKFVKTLQSFRTSGGYTLSIPLEQWVDDALTKINLGKNQQFPFYNSAILRENSFIPSSPSSLGITKVYKPEKFTDTTRKNPVDVIRGHDGSLLDTFGNELDDVILYFENKIYENILDKFKDEDYRPSLDVLKESPGYFRETRYSRNEWTKISKPAFDRWAKSNRINYVENVGFDLGDRFSWNYSETEAPNGEKLPGFWRGIYQYFFDTDRPHTHPWEMLGFSQKPQWWENEYGPQPYTSNNLVMWGDIENGKIKDGELSGEYEHLKRPGLLGLLPVGQNGELLDPVQSGIANRYPSNVQAAADWEFGDLSQAEYTWRTSSDYVFALTEILYLAFPVRFIEYNWNNETDAVAHDNQFVDTRDLKRLQSEDYDVHNEVVGGERKTVYGVSQWISNRLTFLGKDIKTNFGDIVRDLGVRLTYRVGGYTKSNTLRVFNDSFGLIPQENVNITLYKSSPVNIKTYSGVIIERDGRGYKVYGYNNIDQNFYILPTTPQSPRSNIELGDIRVTKAKRFETEPQAVPYGKKFSTRQEVFDFLVSYQKFLEGEGWLFDNFDQSINRIIDFEYLGEQFLIWTLENLSEGNFMVVSPLSSSAKLSVNQGQVDNIQTFVQGSFSVLNREGYGITTENFSVTRLDNEFSVTVTDETNTGIHLLRLSIVEYEHIVIIDNETKFDDLIYSPVLGLRQPRLRLFIQKTQEWKGKGSAFGFIIRENGLVDNFEKSVNDIQDYYSIRNLNEGTLTRDVAKHTIGYQNRDYFDNLLLDNKIKFEFYKGFIREKGTIQPINKILRSDFVTQTADFSISEEWAFEIGEYGNLEQIQSLQLDINIDEFKTNPQLFKFISGTFDDPEDSVISITPDDERWVLKREEKGTEQFRLRGFKNDTQKDLPNSGYIRVDEPDYNFIESTELTDLYFDISEEIGDGDLFWQPLTNNGGWNVYRASELSNVDQVSKGINEGDPGIIQLESAHNLISGDYIFIVGSTESSPDYEGFNKVVDVPSATEFELETPVETEKNFSSNEGPVVLVLKSVRFADIAERDNFTLVNGFNVGDKVFVDKATNDRWEVFEWNGSGWDSVRQENDKVNANQLFNTVIYDNITNKNVIQPQLFDPYKGFLPSRSERLINYLIDYDPAKYTDGDSERFQIDPEQAWGSRQQGELWLDLRNARWLDYEQGELEYRLNNWGRLAPGTRADVYEWTRSPVPPSQWQNYVNNFDAIERNFKPSGTLEYGAEQPYVVSEELDQSSGRLKRFYYFWVKNPDFVPPVTPFPRELSARNISEAINNPRQQSISWLAPISTNAFVLANTEPFLNNESRVLIMNFVNNVESNITHKQWLLARENDEVNPPYIRLWNKMKDSLIGRDRLGNSVPDLSLKPIQRYGNKIRPRQSWFKNRLGARLDFVLKANKILEQKNVVDGIQNWDALLRNEEPLPVSSQWDQSVFGISDRNALQNNISIGTKILVESDVTLGGKWSIYEYGGGSSWTLLEEQLYRVEDFWMFVDYFREGFSEQTFVSKEFPDIPSRNSATGFKEGDVVRVLDNGGGRWALYQYSKQGNISNWTLVAVEDGTIQFKESLAKYDESNSELDNEASTAFEFVIDSLKENLLSILEQNSIFFNMIHVVHTEQQVVDWAFKTSYIFGIGNVDILEQDFIFIQNQSEQLVDFVEEAKPYHTKVRGLLERKQVPTEIVELDIDDSCEITATIKFDRVTCEPTLPDGINPKNVDVSQLTTADRIKLFYKPTDGMPAKVYDKLINRCEYDGTVLDGKSFLQFGTLLGAGYDNQDYDNSLGYDFTEDDIKEFYDVFVNGGTFDGSTPVSIGNSGIIIDGNKFHQPFVDSDSPEERVDTRIGDPLNIEVYVTPPNETVNAGYDVEAYDKFSYDFDETDAGVPPGGGHRVRIKKYFGEQGGTTGPFSVGQIPRSKEAIFVFVNDVLMNEGINYTVDWSNPNPVINLISPIFENDIIKIQSYSGGGSPVRKRIYELGTSETVYDVCETIPNSNLIFVSVDGEIADFTVSGSEVTITNPIPSNSTVIVLFFEDDEMSIIKTQQEVASVNGQETFTIDRPAQSDKPSYKTTVVHKNGKRLNPPLMKLYKPEPFETQFKVGTEIVDSSLVRVWNNDYEMVNGVEEDFVVNYLVDVFVVDPGSGYQIGDKVVVTGVGNGAEAEVSNVGPSGEILSVYPITVNAGYDNTPYDEFSYDFEEKIDVKVTKRGNGYDVDPSLSITSTSGSGAILEPQINRHTVSLNGYSLAQDDELLVLYEGITDYTIDKTNPDQITINSVAPGDIIKITTFTEDKGLGMQTEVFEGNELGFYHLGEAPYDANHTWIAVNGYNQIHLKDYVLRDGDQGFDSQYQGYGLIYDASLDYGVGFKSQTHTPSDRVVITYFTSKPQTQSAAFRLHKDVFGEYKHYRISDFCSTVLSQPLLSSDKEVVVENANRLGQPNIDANVPGIVFINGERIKFWEIDYSVSGQHVLKRLIRGEGGSGINPDLGAGEVVRDGSKQQEIPGGYVWKQTPDGFLHDNSSLVKFLLDKPGRINYGCEK